LSASSNFTRKSSIIATRRASPTASASERSSTSFSSLRASIRIAASLRRFIVLWLRAYSAMTLGTTPYFSASARYEG
jgi:hypothetical protein